jgi:hypothetical protein
MVEFWRLVCTATAARSWAISWNRSPWFRSILDNIRRMSSFSSAMIPQGRTQFRYDYLLLFRQRAPYLRRLLRRRQTVTTLLQLHQDSWLRLVVVDVAVLPLESQGSYGRHQN